MTEKDEVIQEEIPSEEVPATPEPVDAEISAEDIPAEEPSPEAAFEELNGRYLRLFAEFENFRKRTARERETLLEIARADTIEKLLPVYDNLERAAGQESSDEAYKKGVELILKQLLEIFAKLSVEETPTDIPFDPEFHNAVMHVEDESLPENTIAEVFQKGFKIGSRVIRHAVVKVAN